MPTAATWKLAPVEPTEEMEIAGMRALRDQPRTVTGYHSREQAWACYRAMLAVAPQPSASPDAQSLGDRLRTVCGKHGIQSRDLVNDLIQAASPDAQAEPSDAALLADATRWLHALLDRPPQTREVRDLLQRLDRAALKQQEQR